MKGFTAENPLYGLKKWQPIIDNCSNCTDHGDDLVQPCFIHAFVFMKLREAALGMPTKFCYCIDCDEVICRGLPPVVCRFIADRHQDQEGYWSTVVDREENLQAALKQFRGGAAGVRSD